MPWKEIRVEERRLLVVQERSEGASITELSVIYEVSRKTIYKWLARYEQAGLAGLVDQSRRPLHSPHQVSAEVERAIVQYRYNRSVTVAAPFLLRAFPLRGSLRAE